MAAQGLIKAMRVFVGACGMIAAVGIAPPVSAEPKGNGRAIGQETGFALPRFVSMRASKANVRRGPSLDHKIDWVFDKPGLPVAITGEFGHWRRVEDVDGDGGWVHRALISGVRTGLVTKPEVQVFGAPTQEASAVAVAKTGYIVELVDCGRLWCRVDAGTVEGWMLKADLWGADETILAGDAPGSDGQ